MRSTYKRSTHYRERLRSWCCEDPPIPHAWLVRLREAYDRIRVAENTRLRCKRAERTDGPPLTPFEIRLIIHEAGLSQRQIAERYVSIRYHLQGFLREPQPTRRQLDEMERLFERISEAWERYPELRGGRRNIINLNLVITQLILRVCGQRYYDAHLQDFPQVNREKWLKLFALYSALVRKIKLRVHCSVYRTYSMRGLLRIRPVSVSKKVISKKN